MNGTMYLIELDRLCVVYNVHEDTDFMTDLLSSLDSKIRGWSQSPDKKRLRQRMSKVGELLVLGNVLRQLHCCNTRNGSVPAAYPTKTPIKRIM